VTRLPGPIRRHHHLLAAVLALACLALTMGGVVAFFALGLPVRDLALFPVVAAFAVSGWVLVLRVTGNIVGWLVLITGLGFTFVPVTVIGTWLLHHDVSWAGWLISLSQSSFVFDVGGLVLLLPLLFPTGALPGSRRVWRVVLSADIAYIVLASANLFATGTTKLPGGGSLKNTFALSDQRPVRVVVGLAEPMFLIGIAGSVAALIVRWRSAEHGEREQIKWVVSTLLFAPIPFFLHDWATGVSNVMLTFFLPLVPVSIAVSVSRYRLYDIDRILSRAVGYLLVTGLLVGVYVGCIGIADLALPVGSGFGVAASTLTAAALFQPVRHRVQAVVNRRFNRERYDAARVIDAFAIRLRDEVDTEVVRADLLDVTARAVQPASMWLWVAT
jgi:hypothetical protein